MCIRDRQKPKRLWRDEHTAALDPATAAKVLEVTDRLIQENHLTAMMITHNTVSYTHLDVYKRKR